MIGKPAASDPLPLPGASVVVSQTVPESAGEGGHPGAPGEAVDLVELARADVEGEAMAVALLDERAGREGPRVRIRLRVVVQLVAVTGGVFAATMLYGMLRSICRYGCAGEQFASQSAECALTGSVSIGVLIGWSAGNMR